MVDAAARAVGEEADVGLTGTISGSSSDSEPSAAADEAAADQSLIARVGAHRGVVKAGGSAYLPTVRGPRRQTGRRQQQTGNERSLSHRQRISASVDGCGLQRTSSYEHSKQSDGEWVAALAGCERSEVGSKKLSTRSSAAD